MQTTDRCLDHPGCHSILSDQVQKFKASSGKNVVLYTTRFTYLKVSTYLYLPVSPFFVVDISTVHLLK